MCDFIVWWPVWDHGCDIMPRPWFQFRASKADLSRCSVGFGWPASAYPHSALFLDQNPRLFSISDVKTWCFIIWSRRFTLDSLKILFSVQIDFSAAVWRQRGVNRGSIGAQDPLTWSPKKVNRFCVFTAPSFVNCMISWCGFHGFMINIYDITVWCPHHGFWSRIHENHTEGMMTPKSMISWANPWCHAMCRFVMSDPLSHERWVRKYIDL